MGKRGLLVVLAFLAAGACFLWMTVGQRARGSLFPTPAQLAPPEHSAPVAEMATVAPNPQVVDDTDRSPGEHVAVSAPEPEAHGRTPAEGTLVVRVLRADTGAALARQHVLLQDARKGSEQLSFMRLRASDGTLGDAPRVDALGRCTFRVPAELQTRAIAVDAGPADAGRELVVEPLAAGESREVSLVLTVLDHWVRVEDAADGVPLAAARVRSNTNDQDVLTNREGLAVLEYFPEDADWMQVEAEGYGPAEIVVARAEQAPGSAQVVRLSHTACLRGQVLDERGDPIVQAAIEIVVEGEDLAREGPLVMTEGRIALFDTPDRRWPARTDAAGAFTACGLPSAVPLKISVSFGSRCEELPDRPRLPPGEVREIVFRLRALPDLGGTVRDESGKAVPDCSLWLTPGQVAYFAESLGPPQHSLVSDSAGRFALTDLSPGFWSIGPAPGSGYLPVSTLVHAPEGGSGIEVVVEALVGRLFIAGRVVGPDEMPVSRAHVFSDSGPSGETGSDGSFRIGPFATGPVTLSVSSFTTGVPSREGFQVQAGEEAVVVVLRLASGGRLVGRLVNADTGGPTGGVITLIGADVWYLLGSVTTPGEFAFEDVDPGVYSLSVYNSEGLAGLLEGVEPGKESVVVSMVPGGQLALRFPLADETQQYHVRRGACVLMRDFVAGEERVTQLFPPGPVKVELLSSQGTVLLSRDAEVRAGETLLVDLSKKP